MNTIVPPVSTFTPITITTALLREFSGSKSKLGKILCAEALRRWLAACTWTAPAFKDIPYTRVLLKPRRTLHVKTSKYWCADCQAYLAKDHDKCAAPAQAPHALSVNLRNVWKPIGQQQAKLRELRAQPRAPRAAFELRGNDRMDDATHRLLQAERTKLIVHRTPEELAALPTVELIAFPGAAPIASSPAKWKFAPPSVFVPKHRSISDEDYLLWAEKCFPMVPVQRWWAEQCQLQLHRLGMPTELHDHRISYKGTSKEVEQIYAARLMTELNGGKRVNTASKFSDGGWDDTALRSGVGLKQFLANKGDWGNKRDRTSRDFRANAIFNMQHPERRVGHVLVTCKRKVCGAAFVQVRKGHDYCTENCKRRQWEEKGED